MDHATWGAAPAPPAPAPSSTATAPTTRPERIEAIDALRGFAVLGILAVNIQAFAMIGAAYSNPSAYGSLGGANGLVWWLTHVLFDSKFMAIFSMLFGAGIVMLTDRLEARGAKVARIYYRRTLLLLVMGLLHAHLLWYGDVLYLYGVCGLVLYFARRLSPGKLIAVGAPVLAVASLVFLAAGLSMPSWPEAEVASFAAQWRPDAEAVAREVAVYRSGWLTQMQERVPSALGMQTFFTLVWGLWRAGGMMLIGMGLYKLGVLSGLASRRTYLTMLAAGLLVGLPVVVLGAWRMEETGWAHDYAMFLGSQYNYWGSVLVSLGWTAAVMLLWRAASRAWPMQSLVAVGRMALSMYLAQTLVCTTIFYGHGLGLFGQVERVGQAAIVAAIWVAQLLLAPWWLARFRFGPAEWLWRSLTYWRRQPFRREPAAAVAA
jgi:uncharacterized protein